MPNGKGSEPATRADLEAVRSEINTTISKVAAAVVKTQAEVRELRQTMATKMATKDDVSRILDAIDAFAQKGQTYDQKALSHGAILADHEDKLRGHGRRLTALETKS